jgi:hypothetical protein
MHEIADIKLMVGTYGFILSGTNPRKKQRAELTHWINSAL